MNALHNCGFSDWEVKRAIGKEIPTTDSTYLRGLSRKVSEKFPQVCEYIRLSGYANRNHLRIEELQQKLKTLEDMLQKEIIKNQIRDIIIKKVSTRESLENALLDVQKELGIEKMETVKAYAEELGIQLKPFKDRKVYVEE